jgi:hypothetical protein
MQLLYLPQAMSFGIRESEVEFTSTTYQLRFLSIKLRLRLPVSVVAVWISQGFSRKTDTTDISSKKGTQAVVEAGKSEICRAAWQAGSSGRS